MKEEEGDDDLEVEGRKEGGICVLYFYLDTLLSHNKADKRLGSGPSSASLPALVHVRKPNIIVSHLDFILLFPFCAARERAIFGDSIFNTFSFSVFFFLSVF